MQRRRPRGLWLGLLVAVFLIATVRPAYARLKGMDEWIRVDTPNFTLFSNAGKRRSIEVARNLERFREVLTSTTSGTRTDSATPTYLYLFRNDASLEPYKIGEDGKPENVSGYFVAAPDGNYIAIDLSAAETTFPVVYHEYLHYFLDLNFPEVPLWLNEGLAEFYSTFRAEGNQAEIGRTVDEHLAWLSMHPLIPLRELLAADTSSPDYNEGTRQGTFYAQSWALAHYLLAGSEQRRAKLGKFLGLMRQGEEVERALETTYDIRLGALQSRLHRYVRNSEFNYFRYTFTREFEIPEASVRELPREEAMYRLGDLQVHHAPIRFTHAEEHLNGALAIDSAHAGAVTVLGLLRQFEGRYGEAHELYRHAVQLDPSSARTHMLWGQSLLEEFASTTGGEVEVTGNVPPSILEARQQFRVSLSIAPDNPMALAGLGKTFLFQTEELDEGLQALARATSLVPKKKDVLCDLIILTALSGNLAGARSLLDRGLRPHDLPRLVLAAETAIARRAYDDARELAGAGRYEAAAELLRETADGIEDPQLRKTLRAAEELPVMNVAARALHHDRLVARYNEAMELIRKGSLDDAVQVLEEILVSDPDAEMRMQVQRVLAAAGER